MAEERVHPRYESLFRFGPNLPVDKKGDFCQEQEDDPVDKAWETGFRQDHIRGIRREKIFRVDLPGVYRLSSHEV